MTATSTRPDAEVFDLVHARILRFFPDLVAELGGDPAQLMRRAGIVADGVTEGRVAATYRQVVNLIDVAATELGCADFGLRLAKLQRGGRMFGPLGLVMRHSRTFGEALDYVAQHAYAHSLAARIRPQWSADRKLVLMAHDILLDRAPNKGQAMEQILLVGHLAAVEITGGRARARKVHFRHEPISPARVYRRYFGCEVRFGQNEDGVVFSERDLAAPIVEPDARVYERATAFIDAAFTRHRPPLHAEVRGVIMHFIGSEDCHNERIAAELNLHPRTMHRRLKAEGTAFQKVKDEVRRDLMLYFFQETDLGFTYISERLGFAEQSVMTRTCKLWFDATPSQLRSRGRLVAAAG